MQTESSTIIDPADNPRLRKLLELAVNTTADGIALLDNESKYYYLNNAHVEQFGYSDASEIIGQTWHIFYSAEEIQRIEKDIFPLLIQNGSWRGETLGLKKDGTSIHQEITLTFLEDGGIICVTRIIEDIRQAEKRLEGSLSSLKSIINNSTSGITLENADRTIIEANDAALAIIGLDPSEFSLIGESSRNGLEQYSKLFKDPEKWIERMEKVYTEKVPVFNEVVQLASDSFIERDFIPIHVGKEIQGYLWMIRDVTEYERAKDSLKKLISKEKELNEMRSKLVRTVSHEFKKPILNTLTGIQLLQGQLKNSGDGLYSRGLEHIVEELQGLNESVSKLVKYEALYDRSETEIKPVVLKNLVTNYLNYHFKLFVLSEKFEIKELANEETICINLDLFNLALKNVIENALKYTEYHQKISVKSEIEQTTARLTFSNPVNEKTKPDKSQLGNALYRANPSDEKGLGLGLGIVEHIMNLLEGYVEYEVKSNYYRISLIFTKCKTDFHDK